MAAHLSTTGWLLQQIKLANDDSLLIFLTQDFGKIKVFASKLQRSKKKQLELDYFRYLELELFQPKDSFKLRGVRTVKDYSALLREYERLQFGFMALERVAHYCPEEKPLPEVVALLHQLWTMETVALPAVQSFFYTKLLWLAGVLPRFDAVRSHVWVHPITLEFYAERVTGALELTNHQRQLLEWLRRAEATEFAEKQTEFKIDDWTPLVELLQEIDKNH